MVATSSAQKRKRVPPPADRANADEPPHQEKPACRHTASKAKKRKAEQLESMYAVGTPSTSGRSAEQSVCSKAKQGHEIDLLFAAKQTKAPAAPKQTTKKRVDRVAGSKEDLFGTAPAKDRRRLDGLPVYTTEELRVDQGGGTPECPFDCQCCF